MFTPRVSRATMDIHPAIALGSVFVGVRVLRADRRDHRHPAGRGGHRRHRDLRPTATSSCPSSPCARRARSRASRATRSAAPPRSSCRPARPWPRSPSELPAPGGRRRHARPRDGRAASLRRLPRRGAPRRGATSSTSVRCAASSRAAPYAYYVRPRPGVDLTAPGSVTGEHVRGAAAVLDGRRAPGVVRVGRRARPGARRRARVEAGYAVHRHPLLVRDLACAVRRPAPGRRAHRAACSRPTRRTCSPPSPCTEVGFAVPGTARGRRRTSRERDAREVDARRCSSYVRDASATAGRSVAVADDAEAGIVACGWHQPSAPTTSRPPPSTGVVGDACPRHRRTRLRPRRCSRLLAADDARRTGLRRRLLLSAGDDAVARDLRAVGLRPRSVAP